MTDGLEERLSRIDDKLSELEDFQLLNRLDIISLKDELGKSKTGGAPVAAPSGGIALPPDLEERLRAFTEFSKTADVSELSRMVNRLAGMREEIEKLKLGGERGTPAGFAEKMSMLDSMARDIEELKDAQKYAMVLKSSIDEFREGLKKELKTSMEQLDMKVGMGIEGQAAKLRNELLQRNEELEQQINDVRRVIAQFGGQKGDAKSVEAMRREVQAIRADMLNELNNRIQAMEKIVTADVNAQVRGLGADSKDFEENARKEFDRLSAAIKDQVDSQSRHIGSIERGLSDAGALKNDIEKLKKQLGALEDMGGEIRTLKEYVSHVYFPEQGKEKTAKTSIDYLKSALTQLEVKVGATLENKIAKLKDELLAKNQELANQLRQFDEMRKTLTRLEMKTSSDEKDIGNVKQELQLLSSSQSGLSEKFDSMADEIRKGLAEKTDVKLVEDVVRREVEIIKTAAINELNRRVDEMEKAAGGSIKARVSETKAAIEKSVMDSVAQKSNVKELEESLYKEFDKLRSLVREQADTQARRIDSMDKELSAAKMLRGEVEKLRKQVGPGAEDAGALGKRIDALKTKEEWLESELLKVDLTPLYDKIKELENQLRKLDVSMPVVIE